MSDDEIRLEVNKFLDKITPIIKSVKNKFEEYHDELIKLKEV